MYLSIQNSSNYKQNHPKFRIEYFRRKIANLSFLTSKCFPCFLSFCIPPEWREGPDFDRKNQRFWCAKVCWRRVGMPKELRIGCFLGSQIIERHLENLINGDSSCLFLNMCFFSSWNYNHFMVYRTTRPGFVTKIFQHWPPIWFSVPGKQTSQLRVVDLALNQIQNPGNQYLYP